MLGASPVHHDRNGRPSSPRPSLGSTSPRALSAQASIPSSAYIVAPSSYHGGTPLEHAQADSAVQFLERRRSNDAASLSQRRHSYYNQIQPNLYRRRGSIISVSSFSSTHSTSPTSTSKTAVNGASKSVERERSSRGLATTVVGRAQLRLYYDFSKSDFIVHLAEASIEPKKLFLNNYQLQFSLKPKDASSNCNPVIKRSVDVQKMEKDGRLSASSERFKFAMSYDELLQQILVMELVLIQKRTGCQPTYVPRVKTSVALSLLNPSDDDLLIWVDLEGLKEVETSCGELNVCLQFLPSAARLSLTVHQAINLPNRPDGPPNPFVRAILVQDDKVILKKRKTNVKKATASPSWNEVLTFGVNQGVISRCRLEVYVMDGDRFGSNSRPIGRVTFSLTKQQTPMASTCANGGISAVHLWRETVQGRNVVLPQWLPLEPIINNTATPIPMV